MNTLHGEHQPSFYNQQHGAMTAERAAAVLSKQSHRGERKWWVDTRQEFHEGKARVLHVAVCCQHQKLHPFEAIAIAKAYGEDPKATCISASEITVAQ